jgi:hypothetical protein
VILHRVVQTLLQLVELVRRQRPVAILAREPQLVVADLVEPMISPRPGAKDAGEAAAAVGCFSSWETRDSRAAMRPASGEEQLAQNAAGIRAATILKRMASA